jgi:Domain of unknown function (DUF4397)
MAMKGKLSRVLPLGLALICLGAALLAVGCGSSNSRYRFVQASTGVPNNGSVDLEVDGKNVQTAIGFGQAASYHSSTSGSHKFGLFASGTTTNPYVSSSVSVKGDTTLIAENPFATIALGVYTDDNTAPTTGNVKLRIIQAAPTVAASGQGVDVYVVPTGQGIAGSNPLVSNLTYQAASNYLSLSAQAYDVTVTVRGTQSIINSLTGSYTLTAGQIRTLVILDAPNGGGPYGLLELTDLNCSTSSC